jgi:hypothetical protein
VRNLKNPRKLLPIITYFIPKGKGKKASLGLLDRFWSGFSFAMILKNLGRLGGPLCSIKKLKIILDFLTRILYLIPVVGIRRFFTVIDENTRVKSIGVKGWQKRREKRLNSRLRE